MSAHVYLAPNHGPAQYYIAKCHDHAEVLNGRPTVVPSWAGPARDHTDAGLAQAFADRDKHNRREHEDAPDTPNR